MADYQLLDCFQPELVIMERVKYFNRQLLTADDMVTDQDYFRQKFRRHNRYLHGWGVVCGLGVSADSTEEQSWRVRIDGGYALGPYGDEIYVAESVYLDLASCGPGARTDPCEPDRLHPAISATGGPLYVAIKYAECVARPVRAMPASCACEELACEYSRLRDSFQIECLTELPPSHQPDPRRPLLCELINNRLLLSCPPCPNEPWVVLAEVSLPASPSDEIVDDNIDNFTFRRHIYSTAVLQEQLIECCCGQVEPEPEPEPEPARPVRVDTTIPGDGTVFNLNEGDRRPENIVVTFTKALESFTSGNVSVTRVDTAGNTENISITGTELDGVSMQVTITAEENAFNPGFNSTYMVTLRGNGPNAIRDCDGLRLDGNRNYEEGGDYPFSFEIIARVI